jgi:hypothetical protein
MASVSPPCVIWRQTPHTQVAKKSHTLTQLIKSVRESSAKSVDPGAPIKYHKRAMSKKCRGALGSKKVARSHKDRFGSANANARPRVRTLQSRDLNVAKSIAISVPSGILPKLFSRSDRKVL